MTSLSKYKQILVSNQQKIVLHTVCFPVSRSFTVMLLFNNQLFQLKSRIFKNTHNFKRHRNHVPFLAGIAHKNSTKLIFFQYTITFRSYRFHFFKKVFDFQMRQIFFYIFAILNNIGIRWMGTNKVNAIIRNKIQVASIALMDVNFTVSTFVLEIHFSLTSCKGNIIHIYANDISIKKLRFHKRCAATGELIENQISLFGISKQNISWNIR